MDSIRSIISNLYIYKFKNIDNLNMNNFGKKYKVDDSPSKEETIEKINQEIITNNNQIKTNNKNIYVNININNRTKNPRLDNYNQKYISLKNNNFLKNDVNYVLKNKELIKEQENLMKELKLQKENEAMNLLLNNKARNNSDVRSKLYDYEVKQKKERMKLLKKKGIKLRNLSSKKEIRRNNSQYKSNINTLISNNNINSNINEYEYNQNNPEINEANMKQKHDFTKSVKLPRIQMKPSSSPMLDGVPLLHKDFGKMPEYLEKRKQEIKEAKELEILKEKEKKLPSGYKILSEEERQKRLNNLKNQKRELEEELYKLPIARLSMKQKKTKETIEKSLFDIEEKIYKLIGYKEVIVKSDEE